MKNISLLSWHLREMVQINLKDQNASIFKKIKTIINMLQQSMEQDLASLNQIILTKEDSLQLL